MLATSLTASSLLIPRFAALAAGDKAEVARQAFIWGFPLVLTGRYLDIAAKAGAPLNQFLLSPDLATPATHAAGPNVDTLYGFAWLDLAPEPQVLAVSDSHDRYYSIQLLDAYANSFAYVGRRATGTKAGAFVLTAPGYGGPVPAGLTQIKAPTSKILALVRTLVRGEADLAAAREIHGSYSLGALSEWPKGRRTGQKRENSVNVFPVIDPSAASASYFDELNTLLSQFPASAADAVYLAKFKDVGIGKGMSPAKDAASQALLAAAAHDGVAAIRKADYSTVDNGWRTRFDVRPFIADPLERATADVFGPGTHIADEALYFSIRNGADGARLSGQKRYRLRFPAGQTPPVDAFWSLTLYGDDFFLPENALKRYAITDRTNGLRYGPDGALELSIQHDQPTEGPANWLPAPDAPFQLILRTYQPRRAILDRTYHLPPLELA
jgi:hypothetical protein